MADIGVTDFAFTNTPMIEDVLSSHRLRGKLNLHPAFPYANAVNDRLSRSGLYGTVKHYTSNLKMIEKLLAAKQALTGDYYKIVKSVIKSEVACYNGQKCRSVGLLNVATDFLLGSGRTDLITDFVVAAHSLNLQPYFYTMNSVKLLTLLSSLDFEKRVTVISNFNRRGFRMYPDPSQVMNALSNRSPNVKFIAMSIFVSEPRDDLRFVRDQKIDGVLFGGTNFDHIQNNLNFFSEINK